MQAAIAALPSATTGVARRPSGRPNAALRLAQHQMPRGLVAARALGGGADDKKVLRREEEPEEYWSSKAEREGKSPFQDPLAQIGILAILFPFIFLGFAIAVGWVDVGAGR